MQASIARSGPFAALERILEPMDASSFVAHYYEQQILHIARCKPGYFDDLYSVASFEHGLSVASQFAEHLIMVTGAHGTTPTLNELRSENLRPILDKSYSRGVGRDSYVPTVHPRKLAEAFADGSTLILNAAPSFDPSLSAFCSSLELELGFRVRANAYFTPPSAQGFSLHHDTHDTVILQIEGSKRWSIYEQERFLPLSGEANLLSHSPKLSSHVLMQAGDTLYVPRGTPHEARASGLRSLHVTLGWYQPRVCDIVVAAVQEAARSNLALRRGLRPAWTRDPALRHELTREAGSFLHAIASGDHIAAALEGTARQMLLDGLGESEGYLDPLDGLASLNDDAVLQMRTDIAYSLRD